MGWKSAALPGFKVHLYTYFSLNPIALLVQSDIHSICEKPCLRARMSR